MSPGSRGSISCFSRTGKALAARTTSCWRIWGYTDREVRPHHMSLLAQAGPAFSLREKTTYLGAEMGLNLGRGSILCPYRAFAILGGNDDHDRELCPSCQEAPADLHLLLHCEQEGILAQLAPLPQIFSIAPGPPIVHSANSHHRIFQCPSPR